MLGAVLLLLATSAGAAATVSQTFSFTKGEQSFTVPSGVFSVHVLAVGGSGATNGGAGGAGGKVDADIEVTPGETLYVEVGGKASGASGGFNGGGDGNASGGGGGATDVRTVPSSLPGSLEHRLLVAGGGGGGGALGPDTGPGAGGAAGSPGTNEESGLCIGGGAGKASAGGAGGGGDAPGGAGGLGQGGAGGIFESNGGGGGGGLFGGGGGGACDGDSGAGGGGGSSLVPAGGTESTASFGAAPEVQISYEPPRGFAFTGAEQTFTVPAGVTTVHVIAIGGRGGSAGGVGGAAGDVSGDLAVAAGETLYVEVGGNGSGKGGGGFNGGGAGGAGGGGASDIRTVSRAGVGTLERRLLVAGGGGGGGVLGPDTGPGAGGAAGSPGTNEEGGLCIGGGGGKASAGGVGGEGDAFGAAGVLGQGGAGGIFESNGGGGGGGLYGGGGGGGCDGDSGAGGGGGSNLVPTGGTAETASLSAAPSIQISYAPPPTPVVIAPVVKKPVPAPVIGNASESSKSWRESNALAQISKKSPVGTTFSFVLDQPATVTFAFKTSAPGRKVKGKCVAQTPKNRHKPRCSRTIVAGKLPFGAHAGLNKVRFAGRISASKKLHPGRYTLEIVAVNGEGKKSAPRTLTFVIVK